MAKKLPLYLVYLKRICQGCDKHCSTGTLGCDNGSGRTQHPAELFGDDRYEFGGWNIDTDTPQKPGTPA